MLKTTLILIVAAVGMGFISYTKANSYFSDQAVALNNTFSTAEEFATPTPSELTPTPTISITPTGTTDNIPAECAGMEFSGAPINGNTGTPNNDLIFVVGNGPIDGNAGSDCIVGTEGNDNIKGGSGNDVILGLGGDDSIDGDSGNDKIFGGEGNDTIDGGTGVNYCEGEQTRRCEAF